MGLEEKLLEIKDLSVHFAKSFGFLDRIGRTTKAVDGVSVELGDLEVLNVVGESGSGKTTLGRVVAALQRPTSGKVLFRGRDISKLRGPELRKYRKDVQMVFQDPFASLNPRENIYSIISMPMIRLTGQKDREKLRKGCASLLLDVGLQPDVLDKLPHQLSGGERQRVSIARALASHPRVLVADEPVSMLDASLRLSFMSLLYKLMKEYGMSILFITHDLATARVMGGKTAVMYLGRVVEYGPTSGVLSKPHHPYTELLLATSPRMREEGVGDVTTIEKSERVTKGCMFRPRCKYATAICSETEPPLSLKTEAHLAACHNWLNRGD